MKNLTIGKRILLNSSLLCLVILGLSLLSIKGIFLLRNIGLSLSDDTIPGLVTSSTFSMAHAEIHSLLGQMFLVRTAAERSKIESEIKTQNDKITEAFAQYEPTIFVEEDRQNFTALKKQRTNYELISDEFIQLIKTDASAAEALYLGQLKTVHQDYMTANMLVVAFNVKTGAERGPLLKSTVNSYFLLIGVTSFSPSFSPRISSTELIAP
jgi:Four helix bundle sensory module for signal transduction